MNATNNNDTGSLLLGTVAAKVGDAILIEGEETPRKITYLMGSAGKGNLHACCRGTGLFPTGSVNFEIVPEGTGVVVKPATPSVDELRAMLAQAVAEQEKAAQAEVVEQERTAAQAE